VMWVVANLVLIGSETVLVSVQDRYTVCADRTMGPVIILNETNGTPRLRGSSGSLFQTVWR
jgi:hypothetical protein